MTSQSPLKEELQWVFYLNKQECVRKKRFMPNNLNQSAMFDQLCFTQIYNKYVNFWTTGRPVIAKIE